MAETPKPPAPTTKPVDTNPNAPSTTPGPTATKPSPNPPGPATTDRPKQEVDPKSVAFTKEGLAKIPQDTIDAQNRANDIREKLVFDKDYMPTRDIPESVRQFENHPSPVDPSKVRPGPGPLEGSPKENDPYTLANPNDPNSPVTGSGNPSNPANPPATQSDKPVSETRILNEQTPADAQAKQSDFNKNRIKERDEARLEMAKILGQHDHIEANIPMSSPYWQLQQRQRVLDNP